MPSIYEALDKKALRTANRWLSFYWMYLFHEIRISKLTVARGFKFLKQVKLSKSCITIRTSSPSGMLETWSKPQHSSSHPSRMTERTSALVSTRPSMSRQTLGWHGSNEFHRQKCPFARSGVQDFAFCWTTTAMGTPCAWASAVWRQFSHCSLHCPRTRHHRWRVQKERQGVGEWQGFCTSCSVLHSLDRARLNGLQHLRASNVPQLAQDVLWALVTDLT